MLSCNRNFLRFWTTSTILVGSWNSNIRAAVNDGCSRKALLLFRQMKESGAKPDNLTFPFVSKACAHLSVLQNSEIIHAQIAKSPFSSDIYVQTAMVGMYVKCHRMDSAYALFVGMAERDVASWNAIIFGFCQLGPLEKVFDLFQQMRAAEFCPDSITIISLTQSCANGKNSSLLKAVHSLGIRAGVEADISMANTWIAAYAKCDELGSAESLFNEISMSERTVVSWNSMIGGCAYLERLVEAISFFRRMCLDEIRPDLSTILSLVSVCAHSKALFQGQQIHSRGIKDGFDSEVSVVNTLICLYSRCGGIISARFLFDSMSYRTCVSWTAMIDGYAQKGDLDKALDLFYSMEAAGEKPDTVTVVAVLSACSHVGALEKGRQMDRYVTANGLAKNVVVCNALIDMYAKCGSIGEARGIFDCLHGKTVVSWTTMVTGYAMYGDFQEAFGLFSKMVAVGSKPNCLTFLAVLQACTHAGFLEKGWEYFNLMTEVYKLRPGLEHYACMADLLGRRGRVKQALEFIQNMPVKPDAGVWGALLGACRMHNEIEVGEHVAAHLFRLEPQTAVSYVVMANIYAAKGKWENVARVRTVMKAKGVRKSPGRSLLQVDGKVHAFTVDDRHHPDGSQIYEVLDALALQLKESGFKPSLECPLLEYC